MKNILVAIDFSKGNDQLLLHAREQAKKSKAKSWILFAAPPNPDFVGMEIGPKYIRDNVASELREDHKRLQNMAEVIRGEDIECEALIGAINKGEVYRYVEKPWDVNELKVTFINAHELYSYKVENKELTEKLKEANEKLEKANKKLEKVNKQMEFLLRQNLIS